MESPFHRLQELRRNRDLAELYPHHQDLHERAERTTLVLLVARGPGAVRRTARADRTVQAARVAHVAPVAREVREVQEAHRSVPMVQEVVQEVVQGDQEADLSSKDAAANKSAVDVSKKSCSHKSWQHIRQLTPQYLRVRSLLSEVQQRKK